MRIGYKWLFFVLVLFAACQNEQSTANKNTMSSLLNVQGTDNLNSVIVTYIELKDAFVASNTENADIAASHLLSAAETMRHELGNTNPEVKASLETIMHDSEALINTKDETCTQKLIFFEKISNTMNEMVHTAGLKNGGIYKQFCPMAFEGKGAIWLSNDKEINNPYLPEEMLHCGKVQETF